MSRGRRLTENEYNSIKQMSGNTSAIASIAHRSEETIRMVWKSNDFAEFKQMRQEYSNRYKHQEEAGCHYGIGDKLVATTTNGTLLNLLDDKEDMVKLFTKPIPKSKAEAIQKALKEAGFDIFEDYYYSA